MGGRLDDRSIFGPFEDGNGDFFCCRAHCDWKCCDGFYRLGCTAEGVEVVGMWGFVETVFDERVLDIYIFLSIHLSVYFQEEHTLSESIRQVIVFLLSKPSSI